MWSVSGPEKSSTWNTRARSLDPNGQQGVAALSFNGLRRFLRKSNSIGPVRGRRRFKNRLNPLRNPLPAGYLSI